MVAAAVALVALVWRVLQLRLERAVRAVLVFLVQLPDQQFFMLAVVAGAAQLLAWAVQVAVGVAVVVVQPHQEQLTREAAAVVHQLALERGMAAQA